jgi:hypothetical protein
MHGLNVFGETHTDIIKGLMRERYLLDGLLQQELIKGERYKCAIQWILMKGSMLCVCVFSISQILLLQKSFVRVGVGKINNTVMNISTREK